jgi:hypothetical protein
MARQQCVEYTTMDADGKVCCKTVPVGEGPDAEAVDFSVVDQPEPEAKGKGKNKGGK